MNDRFVEDLKSRVDIVEIVKRYAELKRSGKNYMCRSPFRNEKTPSFCVSPDKQFWYDFGNSEGGDVISFLEKAENISFRESIEMLADMTGVEIPESSFKDNGPSKEEKKDLYDLHSEAADYFANVLQKSPKALDYLKNRGISEVMAKEWNLGYGGDEKDGLSKHLLTKGFTERMIEQSGVSFERDFGDKKMQDRFWGRIMIPICEPRNGDIIAFSGRDILEREKVGKYVNSPENPVYHKSSTLFGFERARKVVREKDWILFVEGNLDVLFAHDLGFTNTVATCGTSLTEEHIRLVKRQTKNIVLAFDSDVAGKKATLRGVDMCLRMGVNPWIVSMEAGKDIAEMAVSDPDMVKSAVENRTEALSFLCERFAKINIDGSLQGEKKYLQSFFTFLKLSQSPLEIDHYLGVVAKKVGRQKIVINDEFQRFVANNQAPAKKHPKEDKKAYKPTREELLVGLFTYDWENVADLVSESVLESLPDWGRSIFTVLSNNKLLSSEQQEKVQGLHLYLDQLYLQDFTTDLLRSEINSLTAQQDKNSEKVQRMKEAEKLAEQLRG